MQKFLTDGNMVFTLIQDGWENGEPRLTNNFENRYTPLPLISGEIK